MKRFTERLTIDVISTARSKLTRRDFTLISASHQSFSIPMLRALSLADPLGDFIVAGLENIPTPNKDRTAITVPSISIPDVVQTYGVNVARIRTL